ncbi:hypothetical protein Mp_2g20970 [Marchantia polymorpha subsp. ruderalis]|uniref:Uncharacterized protein n=1 Tax=Marchantia polymorpha TaxID=3197 RepID=A0A2R6X2W5_MARPO|nr:hypothetical protein MARPO_0040s0115 [Marchantia polymorpha]BBN03129.1 hypothetical protein Mp_2g20970 [Marchantia polymorpha subsp. ruderalis]|eukprot:PTQ40447.1 hypothetical protein MARPO_0040s0115 [Marchantia polymorpha]
MYDNRPYIPVLIWGTAGLIPLSLRHPVTMVYPASDLVRDLVRQCSFRGLYDRTNQLPPSSEQKKDSSFEQLNNCLFVMVTQVGHSNGRGGAHISFHQARALASEGSDICAPGNAGPIVSVRDILIKVVNTGFSSHQRIGTNRTSNVFRRRRLWLKT